MKNKELIDWLIKHYTEEYKEDIKESDLHEMLSEEDEVFSEITGSHRWYDDEIKVVRVGDKYISYDWYHITGDNSAWDMGLQFNINSIKEVTKKQKTIDVYE